MKCMESGCIRIALPKSNFCEKHKWRLDVGALWDGPPLEVTGDPETPGTTAPSDVTAFGDPEPPGATGDPETPGATGDPETPGNG